MGRLSTTECTYLPTYLPVVTGLGLTMEYKMNCVLTAK